MPPTGSVAQVDIAYDRLRHLIVAGDYRPGERLAELPLAGALAVSRTPIREALRRLESDGLVRSTGRGVVVAALDAGDLDEAYQVRAALESLTAELAARRQREGHVAPAELAALKRTARAAEETTARRDLDLAVEHNRAFHRRIAVLAANTMALAVLDRVWDQILVSTRASLGPPARADQVAREHRELLDAIETGDEDGATAAARRHVLHTAAVHADATP
jgi:DNA-binding GntR family transcriptional regulator